MVLLENNSVLPHYLDNTVINHIKSALLILKTSVDKLLLFELLLLLFLSFEIV